MVIILVPDYTRSLEEQEGQQQRGEGVNEIVGVVFFVSESRGARDGSEASGSQWSNSLDDKG